MVLNTNYVNIKTKCIIIKLTIDSAWTGPKYYKMQLWRMGPTEYTEAARVAYRDAPHL